MKKTNKQKLESLKSCWVSKDGWTLRQEDGTPVLVDAFYKDCHDEEWCVVGGRPPSGSSSGRVYVDDYKDGKTFQREFFPQVFDFNWIQNAPKSTI